ncbi:phosphate acyltransferase PlsX [Aliicoccus persicus]|uniref:Phosphate acyltransferase n=1 Tax=Aliicoccus persicus TaxID=930138 RepID=A0A662Z2Q2_9STAP|nr:phosphate acyltransferase PlsX [Aliicoccus persicus]SEV81361.1 phosphate:acyl-[acyl carrier protein] acyltransferase [Aliicoccus persicus]
MVKIAIDLNGGDNAPQSVIDGVKLALDEHDDIEIELYGTKGSYNENLDRVTFTEVAEKIESTDDPVRAVRRKKDSGMVQACVAVKEGRADACFSAGNTGALMSAGLFNVGRIKGIDRPAIASMIPSTDGKGMLLLDMGANVDNRANHLYQFAVMADIYMEDILDRKNPKIGLVNIGSEDNKGSELTKATHKLLKESHLNFQGNFETRDILSGVVDVAVTDGFTGNIILKTIEGTAMGMMGEIKKALTSSFKNKVGAVLVKSGLQNIKDLLDYRQYGGAPLLGLNGHVLKAHGSSDAVAIASAVRQAKRMAMSDSIEKISNKVGSIDE